MKTKFFITIITCCGCFLCACSGDRTPQTGKDTVVNTYHTKDSSKADTSRVVSSDNSATGGTGNTKDTSKKNKTLMP